MEIIAHRGFYLQQKEENTVQAFIRAVAIGCPVIELDARLTKDLSLVVCHDEKIEFKDEHIKIRERHLEELVENGIVIDQMTDIDPLRPPTLKLVLKFFLPQVKINVELKDDHSGISFTALLGRMRDAKLLPADFESRIIVSSFLPDEIAKVKESFPEIEAALLVSNFKFSFIRKKRLLGWIRKSKVQAIHLDEESVVDRKVIIFFQQRGLKVRIYTVNDPKLLADYERFPIQGVFTDKPKELLAFEQNLHLSKNCGFCASVSS